MCLIVICKSEPGTVLGSWAKDEEKPGLRSLQHTVIKSNEANSKPCGNDILVEHYKQQWFLPSKRKIRRKVSPGWQIIRMSRNLNEQILRYKLIELNILLLKTTVRIFFSWIDMSTFHPTLFIFKRFPDFYFWNFTYWSTTNTK